MHHLSTALTAALVVVANAAPALPTLDRRDNSVNALDSLSGYFNLIASKVEASKLLSTAPLCDLSKARMPDGIDGLPPPDNGLTVRHVAVGRGTQNYTCDANNAHASPKAAGAVATLFNASCIAALYPDLLSRIPPMAVHFQLDEAEKLGPTAMAKSGVHYFDGSTPFFNLDTPALAIGRVPCAKNSSAKAPSTAAVGQKGEKAVTWLRLTAMDGTTGDIKDVYRVDTAGGSPPATCKDMPATFEVQYSAV
ncbi:uncharacterized protein MAM_01706 [Metarhizium album ARSEF 1941]|uniref:Malate dehydrogenase n=1 Tax=Metarhizium album (strain ARSEF 1941) TaxID=1081103 RepID=A0A0B2X5A3_METAS|nr:uncharacterized protein MAM_01706 [Metarhizium album ARSEF 1941]KHO00928.1 hypothetical protein MAM_01706 [Metarhizium album ARSEF 1941]